MFRARHRSTTSLGRHFRVSSKVPVRLSELSRGPRQMVSDSATYSQVNTLVTCCRPRSPRSRKQRSSSSAVLKWLPEHQPLAILLAPLWLPHLACFGTCQPFFLELLAFLIGRNGMLVFACHKLHRVNMMAELTVY